MVISARFVPRGLAGSDFGLGTADRTKQTSHFTHHVGQMGLGIVQCQLAVVRIKHNQRIASEHPFAVIDVDGDHGAMKLWRDLYDIPLNIGVIGTGIPATIRTIPSCPEDGGKQTGCPQ
ncbi:hypothetical protein D3C77_615020 [compost metagenome]